MVAILDFLLKMTLTIFDLQGAPIFPTKFRGTGLSVQAKKCKIDFKMAAMAVILDFQSKLF